VTSTSDLIEQLSRDAAPVHRLAPPLLRSALFLVCFVVVLGVATMISNAWPSMIVRLADTRFAAEMAATALTGVAAICAAFNLTVPGTARLWLYAPVPPLTVWLGLSGYGCYRNWLVYGADGSLALGRSSNCFMFIVLASVPLAAALFFALRRARPLNPVSVMVVAMLGVAALAATALQFFHPFDVTVMDLGIHVLAVSFVIATATRVGAPRLGLP
jgi:hypothetical protein